MKEGSEEELTVSGTLKKRKKGEGVMEKSYAEVPSRRKRMAERNEG